MRQRLLTAVLTLTLCSMLPSTQTAAAASQGSEIYKVLQQRGLLEDYMSEEVGEIAGTLVDAAGRWAGYRLNRPYAPGLVNFYLINSERLPDANVLDHQGVDLSPHSLRGNAMAHEETGIVFVDTVLLKSLVTAALIFTESDADTAVAVGAIRARGINAFREVWDPALNPMLKTAAYTDRWAMLASGALAFILAHEMGHIYLGQKDSSLRRRPMRFKDKTDKDLHWVCDDLIDAKYRHQQRIEQEADDFAVTVLSRVLFPDGVLTQPLLRYELGARWYIVYSLANQAIETLYATESQNILAFMRVMLGPQIYSELVAARPTSGKGAIHVFFPKSHPANIRRASASLDQLARSPYSVYHREPPSTSQDIAMFELVISKECENLKERL